MTGCADLSHGGPVTREDVERYLEYWQDRLNLGHWNITLKWEEPAKEGEEALAVSADSYELAYIAVRPDYPDAWDHRTAEETVVHELVHLLFRDLQASTDFALAGLPKAAKRLAAAQFDHELEGIVDRVAVLLVAIDRTEVIEDGSNG